MATAADSRSSAFAQASAGSIWLGPQQQAGLTHLCTSTPFRILIGPRSSGKTTLLRHFRHHLDEVLALDLSGPQTDSAGVLACLLEAVALGVDGLTANEQRNLLAVFCRERRSLGTRIILCVDDVSAIAPPAWEEILGLCALESSGRPLTELAVVGDHREAESRPLRELVLDGRTSAVEAVRYLGPPEDDDIRRYIAWQLERIGSRAKFSAAACGRINELCEGRFADVNRICTAIFAAPFTAGRTTTIDVDDVDATSDRLRRLESAPEPSADAATEAPPDRLVIERQGRIERIVPLSGRLVIGRSDKSDLKLDGPQVSRSHVMILPAADGKLALIDLNSVHGVSVNGQRVHRQTLRTGDVISFCQYRLSLVRAGAGGAELRPADSQRTQAAPLRRPPPSAADLPLNRPDNSPQSAPPADRAAPPSARAPRHSPSRAP